MARMENPPFARGETYYNLFASSTQSSSDGTQLEGKAWLFEDIDPINKVARSNQYVTARVVRNISGGTLAPKRLANLATSTLLANGAGFFGGQVDGYSTTTAARGYPIDEFLPSAGVQNLDLFWLVTEGPAKVQTDLAALTGVINIGSRVMAQTAVTSGATTAGRVILQDLTGATAALGNAVMNYIGTAMSAATSSNTGADLLIDVGHW